eukprot:5955455-Pyramimonas_sp.AAC.2
MSRIYLCFTPVAIWLSQFVRVKPRTRCARMLSVHIDPASGFPGEIRLLPVRGAAEGGWAVLRRRHRVPGTHRDTGKRPEAQAEAILQTPPLVPPCPPSPR